MPQRKSAQKELRKNLKRRERNLLFKKKITLAIKRFKRAIQNKDLQESQSSLKEAYKLLDKASSKGIMHKNTSARKKSRLAQLLNKIKQPTATSLQN